MSGPVVCGLEDAASVVGATFVARTLAERFELPLVFVHVVEPGQRAVDDVRSVLALRQAVDALEPVSEATWRVEAGHPADRLLAVAEDCRASFVVVGCHGPRSSLLGSISADVSRRASCPVVVVPPDACSEQLALVESRVDEGSVAALRRRRRRRQLAGGNGVMAADQRAGLAGRLRGDDLGLGPAQLSLAVAPEDDRPAGRPSRAPAGRRPNRGARRDRRGATRPFGAAQHVDRRR